MVHVRHGETGTEVLVRTRTRTGANFSTKAGTNARPFLPPMPCSTKCLERARLCTQGSSQQGRVGLQLRYHLCVVVAVRADHFRAIMFFLGTPLRTIHVCAVS